MTTSRTNTLFSLCLCLFALMPVLLTATQAGSAGLDASSAQYITFTGLVKDKPKEALKIAQGWLAEEKNSSGALHCQALARYGMKEYGTAAADLEVLARNIGKEQPKLWTGIARQSATAYNLAGKHEKAATLLGEAISLADSRQLNDVLPGLLMDRADIYMTNDKNLLAIQDMDHILATDDHNNPALLARAKAFHNLGLTQESRNDIDRVLKFNPKNQEARELLKKLDGKKQVAKASAKKKPVKKKAVKKKSTKKKPVAKKKVASKKK